MSNLSEKQKIIIKIGCYLFLIVLMIFLFYVVYETQQSLYSDYIEFREYKEAHEDEHYMPMWAGLYDNNGTLITGFPNNSIPREPVYDNLSHKASILGKIPVEYEYKIITVYKRLFIVE